MLVEISSKISETPIAPPPHPLSEQLAPKACETLLQVAQELAYQRVRANLQARPTL